MWLNPIDIVFAIGTASFGIAALRQLMKTYRTKRTGGISETHYHIKMFALSCYLIGYACAALPISFLVTATESSITFTLVYLIRKYRKEGR